MRKLKAYDIIQEHNQLTKVTRLPAEPFTLMGNICKIKYTIHHADVFLCFIFYFPSSGIVTVATSDIITHGIAPMPIE